MTDDTTLPTTLDTGRRRLSTLDQLADIPEEEIWLQKQKSARTRRAYLYFGQREPERPARSTFPANASSQRDTIPLLFSKCPRRCRERWAG
jgi:hypothetical protein